ncbi:MAG: thioredoxin family protein [Myxococcales bacterium]|nr:thioredoxin family protein [Myxococcales bacterium]
MILASVLLSQPPAVGAAFPTRTLGEALASAGKDRKVVAVVSAEWCGPCNQLAADVLETEDGQALAGAAVTFHIDAETAAGREVVERHAVLGYPTTLVLAGDGAELDRIEGYPGPDAWLGAVKAGLARKEAVSVEWLIAQVKAQPGDGEAALALAQARLVRGETAEALPALERLAARGDEVGANAGRVLGRYFVRVRRDGPKGAEVFAGLARQYRARPEGEEFLMWAAQGYLVAGQREKALALLDELVATATTAADSATDAIRDAEHSRAWFLVRYDADPAAAATSVATVLTLSPGYAPALYLDAELAVRGGDLARAKASIQAAITSAPGKALYVNFARRHGLSDAAKAP